MFEQFNKLFLVLTVYILLYVVVVFLKPSFIFNNINDCTRPFGVGYKHKTIVPIWVIAIVFAIVSYLLILNIIQIM